MILSFTIPQRKRSTSMATTTTSAKTGNTGTPTMSVNFGELLPESESFDNPRFLGACPSCGAPRLYRYETVFGVIYHCGGCDATMEGA
jgi:hypothetical protein